MGIINAVQNIGLKIPIVLRMKGTNVEEARRLVEGSGIKMIVTDDLDDAAAKAVSVAEIVTKAKEGGLAVEFAPI